MKITSAQTSPNFKGLHMPTKEENIKRVGEYFANELEKARPALEKMAEKTDIFVKPEKAKSDDYFAWCKVFVMNTSKNLLEKYSNFCNRCEATVRLINLPTFEKIDARKGETTNRQKNESLLVETVSTLKDELKENTELKEKAEI